MDKVYTQYIIDKDIKGFFVYLEKQFYELCNKLETIKNQYQKATDYGKIELSAQFSREWKMFVLEPPLTLMLSTPDISLKKAVDLKPSEKIGKTGHKQALKVIDIISHYSVYILSQENFPNSVLLQYAVWQTMKLIISVVKISTMIIMPSEVLISVQKYITQLQEGTLSTPHDSFFENEIYENMILNPSAKGRIKRLNLLHKYMDTYSGLYQKEHDTPPTKQEYTDFIKKISQQDKKLGLYKDVSDKTVGKLLLGYEVAHKKETKNKK